MRKFTFAAAAPTACACAILLLGACKSPDGAARRAGAAATQPAQGQATPGAKPQATKSEPADGVRRVTPAESQELAERGKAVIVDVRDANSFKTGRIKGSINIPRTELLNRLGELPKDKLLIFYCA